MKADTKLYSPQDFINIFSKEENCFFVGGQAVNIWGFHYYDYTSEFAPFVSADIDLLGSKKELQKLSSALKVKAHYFPLTPPTNEVGVMIVQNDKGLEIPIEVLSSIHGISNELLTKHKYTIIIDNIKAQVPNPIALLKAKIANVADFPQKDRQDKKHVQILAKLMPAYLNSLQESVNNKRIKEREMLDLLEFLLSVVTTDKGSDVLKLLNINRFNLFMKIDENSSPKIVSFIKKRLSRILS